MNEQINTETVTYENVKWFRRNSWAWAFLILFSPALLLILLTGEVYYKKSGVTKTWSKPLKITLIIVCVLILIRALTSL
jgi:hypothetical protein